MAQYRVNVQGLIKLKAQDEKLRTKAQVRTRMVLPLVDDGNVIAVAVSQKPPRHENSAYRDATIDYVKPATLLSATAATVLKKLIKEPTLVMLNQLLALNDYADATPLEFWPNFNYLSKGFDNPVGIVPTGNGNRVIVLCRVRPRGATWTTKPDLRFPPVTAFIFDQINGSLITSLGGGQSDRGSYDTVSLMNLGGGDDYFLHVSRFEKREVNDKGSRWYRVSRAEHGPSLSIQHDANGNAFSGTRGPGDPPGEFGYLEYVSKGRSLGDDVAGLTSERVAVPRQIYWDPARNKFSGPASQSVNGVPIYRVIAEESAEFVAFSPEPTEIISGGGRTWYGRGHSWTVMVPKDTPVQVCLQVREKPGDAEYPISILDYSRQTLKPGTLHTIEFDINAKKQTKTSSTVLMWATVAGEKRGDEKFEFAMRNFPINNEPSVKGQPVLRADEDKVVLFRRSTSDAESGKSFTLELVVQKFDPNAEVDVLEGQPAKENEE